MWIVEKGGKAKAEKKSGETPPLRISMVLLFEMEK
jgi:hypothetical protein